MNDKELIVRTIDLMRSAAAGASRFDDVTLPFDDKIAQGPSSGIAPEVFDDAIGKLRASMASDAAALSVAKTIRGLLGPFVRGIVA